MVFFLSRTPKGYMTDEQIKLLRRMVRGVLKIWQFLRMSMDGPKIHDLEDHLLLQIEKISGTWQLCRGICGAISTRWNLRQNWN